MRRASAILAVVLVTGCGAETPTAAYVVHVRPGVDPAVVARAIRIAPDMEYLPDGFAASLTPAQHASAVADPRVAAVDRDTRSATPAPNSP